MESLPKRQNAWTKLTVFGIIPCIVGIGIGQLLRWSGAIWLSDTSGVWPVVCLITAAAASMMLTGASPGDKVIHVCVWLIIAWTWLYFPLWVAATEVPQSSAVVHKDGRVYVAGDWARHPTDNVWLMTGRSGKRIVRNVVGTALIRGVEVKFKFAESFVARRDDDEDLARHIISAADAALAVEAGKSRSSRIALFAKSDAHDRLRSVICRAIVASSGDSACPLSLTLAPHTSATIAGGLWSTSYSEEEAIREKHLPTLMQLLTQDNSRLADRERVFALFMELAETGSELVKVARKPRLLTDRQFDDLIGRILADPNCESEVVNVLVEVKRLSLEQRRALRAKAFREASVATIVKSVALLHISDSEIALLAPRLRQASEANPETAVSILEVFGERLPAEIANDVVRAIINGRPLHALSALRHLNFSISLRETLLRKVLADATLEDFEAAKVSRETLESTLSPTELRALLVSVLGKSKSSAKWLEFAIRALPAHAMSVTERKTLVDELMFSNMKSALEYVSENRQYLDSADVSEVTRSYAMTVTREMCLHLTHRNTNRRTEYFSESQLQIFRDCAEVP